MSETLRCIHGRTDKQACGKCTPRKRTYTVTVTVEVTDDPARPLTLRRMRDLIAEIMPEPEIADYQSGWRVSGASYEALVTKVSLPKRVA